MSDNLNVFPGNRLESPEALPIISRLRRKYHQGPAENRIRSREELQRYFEIVYPRYAGETYDLPDDIREYRLLHYGEPMETLNFSAGGMVLTWSVFPQTAIPTTLAIFSHPHFLEYSDIYFSWHTTGEYLWNTTSLDVRRFFQERFIGMDDLYVFDKDLKWCIAAYDEDRVSVVGDFKVF